MNTEHYTAEQIAAAAERRRGDYDALGLSINQRSAQPGIDAHILATAYLTVVPDLLDGLRETADWLDGRAKVLREYAERLAHMHGMQRAQPLRDEAARFEGRAALIRILITKATGG